LVLSASVSWLLKSICVVSAGSKVNSGAVAASPAFFCRPVQATSAVSSTKKRYRQAFFKNRNLGRLKKLMCKNNNASIKILALLMAVCSARALVSRVLHQLGIFSGFVNGNGPEIHFIYPCTVFMRHIFIRGVSIIVNGLIILILAG